MTSLTNKAILSGADNRPPMLEKVMYDSWKSRMELYMLNRQHGGMILESVENAPLLWLTIEEDGVTRLKKYSKLSATEAIQADCDVKAMNIILQGLPPEVYTLVSTHKVAKELWKRIQMLMQGTSLTKQESECKLYDEFDKFAYGKGESLCDFYLRFSQLLKDMNIYNIKLEQFQSYHQHQFQPQASTYQSSSYATPYHTPQCASQAPSSTNLSISYPLNDIQSSVNHNVYMASSSIPQMEYALTVHQQTEFSSPETGLVLRTSSNPHQQATINNGMVTIPPIQGRKNSTTAGRGVGILSRSRDVKDFKQSICCHHNAVYQADDLDAYDSDCDELNSAKIALMANLSHYGSDNLAEINQDNKLVNEILTVDLERYKNQERILKDQNNDNKVSGSYEQSLEIKTLKHTLSKHLKEKESLVQKVKELNNIVFKRNQYAQTVHMLTKPQLFYDHSTRQALGFQNPLQTEEPNLSATTTIVEVPKELPKVSMVNSNLKKLKFHLASFDMVVKERTTATAITEGTCGFKHTKACFKDDIIPFVETLKELFNSFDQFLIDELSEVQNVFKQIEQAVEQHCDEKNKFQDKMNFFLKDNDRLLQKAISVDIVNIVVHEHVKSACMNVNACERYVTIESELQKDFIKRECYDTLFQKYNTLEKHCISLEVDHQLKKEISQRNTLFSQESAPTFADLFEINDLKAQSQVKDTVILKLKERLQSLSALCVRSKEQCDDLIKQVNLKSAEISDLNASLQEKVLVIVALKETLSKHKGKDVVTEAVTLHPIDLELLKIEIAPLAPKMHKNRTSHTDYIRHTQEEATTLREIIESERFLNPLNTSLDYACKYTKRIQELLIILQQTYPCITDLGTKLVAVTPNNKDKQIRFTDASGSQSQDTIKNDRIQQTPRKAKKNKLEDHLRTVRPSLNKKSIVDTKVISSVTNSMSNVNSDLKCATCNGCLFSDNHDLCVVAYINSVNASIKSKSVKKLVKRKFWQPTGKVFTTVGHRRKPTGRTFTLVGNVCLLNRIATTTIVPPRKPIPMASNKDKPVITLVYSRKSKAANKKVPVSNSTINKSLVANKIEPNNS
nr:hypothetical protein [Tanacetum cinerariifolium]